MATLVTTATAEFLAKVGRELADQGARMMNVLEGRLIAHQGGSLTFRTVDNRPGQGEAQFGAYVDLWAGMTAPVAIVWPQRSHGSVATNPHHARHLAVVVKLSTGFQYGVVDAGRSLEWLKESHSRVFQIKRCLRHHSPEELEL